MAIFLAIANNTLSFSFMPKIIRVLCKAQVPLKGSYDAFLKIIIWCNNYVDML